MKIIKTKTYKKLIESYAPQDCSMTYKQLYEVAKLELEQARNLKTILDKLADKIIGAQGGTLTSSLAGSTGGHRICNELPDNVLQYTEDILGGKVIKQDGIKCLVIDKDGNVKSGLTKQKADKGYSYKLVREQYENKIDEKEITYVKVGGNGGGAGAGWSLGRNPATDGIIYIK